jgi:glycine cleavage system regulatory protein
MAAMAHLVLTVIAPDRPGIVETISKTALAHGANWEASRMVRLGGRFAGVLLVSVDDGKAAALESDLRALRESGLQVTVERGGPGAASEAEGARPLKLELVGLDRPGIIREVSRVLAARGVNVEELHTQVESAPMSGETLFRMNARVRCPGTLRTAELRGALESIAGELMVDLELGKV